MGKKSKRANYRGGIDMNATKFGLMWKKTVIPIRKTCIICECSCLKIYWRVQIFGNGLNQTNSVQNKIKSSLKSGNACYHWVRRFLSSSLLSKKLKVNIYRTIILLVVAYWCKTWSLTLREERTLRVFENRVLRGIFGPKRDEVTGQWRKLHNWDLNDWYSS